MKRRNLFLIAVFFSILTINGVAIAAMPMNNVAVSAIRTNSVSISWDSTIAGTSQIEYGTTMSYGSITSEDSFSYFHAQTITGLAEGTTYHYRIKSKEWNGTETISPDYMFTTRTQIELENTIKAARLDSGLPKTYYVSTTGNNANDGLSIPTAWRTPSYAATKADAGDIIVVLDGTYTSEHVSFSRNGIDVAPITMRAQNPYMVTLDGVSWAGKAFDLSTDSYILIEGLTATRYDIAVSITSPSSHHITIINSDFSNTQQSPVGVNDGAHDVLFENVTIHDIRSGSSANLIYISGWDEPYVTKRIKFKNVTAYGGIHNGFNFAPKYLNDSGVDRYVIDGFTIENNDVYGVSGQSIVNNWATVNNLVVLNSTVHDGMAGIVVTVKGGLFKGNDVYGITTSRPLALQSETGGSSNVIFDDNYVHDCAAPGCGGYWGTLVAYASNVIVSNSRQSGQAGEIRFDSGSETSNKVTNMFQDTYTVRFNYGAGATFEYPNGDVFKLSGGYATTYYPDRSSAIVPTASTTITANHYNMAARPSLGYMNITVNRFDSTLDNYSITVSSSVAENPAWFNLTAKNSNAWYTVKRDGVVYATLQSGADKVVRFYYNDAGSEWSNSHTFEFGQGSSPATGNNYYVATWGNNAGLGTLAQPWQTPSYAAQQAKAGDTIYLIDGTWYNEHVVFSNSGNSTHQIILTAYNGTPTLDGVDKTGTGITTSFKNFIVVSGITVRKYTYGYWGGSNSNNTIFNSTFYNMSGDGITLWTDANDILIDSVVVYDTGDHGIHLWNQNRPTIMRNASVRNSRIYNAPHNLIDYHTNVSDSTVENNDLYFTADYAGLKQVGLYLHNGQTDNIIIRNNTFHDQPRPLEILHSENVTVVNNTFTNISGRCLLFAGWGLDYENNPGVFDTLIVNNTCDGADYGAVFQNGDIVNTFRNITFDNNLFLNIKFNDYWLLSGNYTAPTVFKDTLPRTSIKRIKIQAQPTSAIYFDDSSGSVMAINGGFNVLYYPSHASIPITNNYTTDLSMTTYNMTARPSSGYATVDVNKFNTTLPIGNILINITANTTNNNNVVFTANLKPYVNYLIKKDGVNFTAVHADSAGKIAFNNSVW